MSQLLILHFAHLSIFSLKINLVSLWWEFDPLHGLLYPLLSVGRSTVALPWNQSVSAYNVNANMCLRLSAEGGIFSNSAWYTGLVLPRLSLTRLLVFNTSFAWYDGHFLNVEGPLNFSTILAFVGALLVGTEPKPCLSYSSSSLRFDPCSWVKLIVLFSV